MIQNDLGAFFQQEKGNAINVQCFVFVVVLVCLVFWGVDILKCAVQRCCFST